MQTPGLLLVSSQKGKAVLFEKLDDFSTDINFPGSGNLEKKMTSREIMVT